MTSSRVGLAHTAAPSDVPLADTWASRAAVAVFVGSLFFERLEKHYYLGGKVPIPDLFFLVVAVCFAAFVLARMRVSDLARGRLLWTEASLIGLVVLLGAISVLALLFGPVGLSGATQVAKTFAHLVFLLLVGLLLARGLSEKLIAFAFRAFLLIASFCCALAVLQAVDVNALHTGASAALGLGTRGYGGFLAPLSIFSEPAYLGYAALEAILVAWLLSDVRRSRAGLAGMAVCVAGLVLSLSAGALAIAGVIVVYLIARGRLGFDRWALVGLAAAVVLIALMATVTPVGRIAANRATSIWSGSDPSAQYRRAVDDGAIKVWHRSPAVGVGLGNSRVYLPQYVHLSFLPTLRAVFVDSSSYAGLLAETGPLGVLGLVVALAMLFRPAARDDGLEELTRTLVLVIALQCFVLGAFLRPSFWVVAGLRLGVARRPVDSASGAHRRRRNGRELKGRSGTT